MPSAKQIKANQANAKLSTGPVTLQGKNKVRYNAFRHGLTGQFAVMSPFDGEQFRFFEAAIIAEFKPETTWEHSLTISIAQDQYRLNRMANNEHNLLGLGHDRLASSVSAGGPETHAAACITLTFEKIPDHFLKISLYEGRLQRKIAANKKELMAMQAERRQKYAEAQKNAELLLRLALMKKTPLDAAAKIRENGFEFSLPQLVASLRHQEALEEARHYEKHHWNPKNPWKNYYPPLPKAA